MKATSLSTAIAVALLLGACASPVPTAPERPPEATAATPPQPAPPPVAAPARPAPSAAGAPSGSDLEPLPPPADNLWARIGRGYAMPELDDPLVAKWEQWYASRPDYVERMIERSRRYLYYIVVEVERRGMPAEVALLPMVESAYNPVALSSSRASGIWQFMPATGTLYGLKQNWWFDSRRDVVAATAGALNYLQKLYGDFNDWQLALAAYNWGEGNVAKSVARNQALGLPTRYVDLKMPDETRNYLPKLQAVKNIVRDPAKYGLAISDIPDAPYFAVIKTTRKMDVKMAASLAEMPLDEFQYLNPQHNRPVIAGADETTILLPIDKAELFAAKLELAEQPLVSWQAYHARPGETLPQIAAKFGMTAEALRAVNGIGARSRVPAGQTLLVPAQQPTEAGAASLTTAVFTTVPQGRTFYYRVGRGDTLAAIASRYDVSVDELRRWNSIPARGIVVGERLRITSDLAPDRGTSRRATGAPVRGKSAYVNRYNGSAAGAKAPSAAGPNGVFLRTSAKMPAAGKSTAGSAKGGSRGAPAGARPAASGGGAHAGKTPEGVRNAKSPAVPRSAKAGATTGG